jgi:DNA-binding MarR family transcriptional regulator
MPSTGRLTPVNRKEFGLWSFEVMKKEEQVSRRPSASREEAVFVDLLRTCDLLSRGLAQILKPEDISPTQYNVLRILRGSPDGLPCGEIASRMITRDPDVTRLLDRMEERGLISRLRDIKDRRTVIGKLTTEGLKLLARRDEPIQEAHRKQLGHLGRNRLWALTELLAAARANVG